MSERGSFVTEFIYCKECFAAAKRVLVNKHGGMSSQVVLRVDGTEAPIIAGYVSGLGPGEEAEYFELEYRERLEPLLCHPLSICILTESRRERKIVTYRYDLLEKAA